MKLNHIELPKADFQASKMQLSAMLTNGEMNALHGGEGDDNFSCDTYTTCASCKDSICKGGYTCSIDEGLRANCTTKYTVTTGCGSITDDEDTSDDGTN